MRIVFLGAGKLAQPAFRALLDEPSQTMLALITQPDRTGAGHHRHSNPLKDAATAHNVPILQPEKINAPESVAALRELSPDLFVVAAYGQILSSTVLSIPRCGSINLHASLLPKYRGATPIHAAVYQGDAETGVTIMKLEPKLDAGPMLAVVKTPIGPDDTTGDLEQRLADLAVSPMLNVIARLERGDVWGEQQDPNHVTRAGKFTKDSGIVDWTQPAVQLERQVRAFQPWPGSTTWLHPSGRPPLRLLLVRAAVAPGRADREPGEVIESSAGRLTVQTGDGGLQLLQIQPEGRRAMSSAEFLNGRKLTPADRFGRLD